MEWVYITGEQVAFAAQCVQGLVHETVRIAQKINIRKVRMNITLCISIDVMCYDCFCFYSHL